VQVPHWAEPVPVDVADDVGAVVVAVVVTGAEDDVARVVDDVTAVVVTAEEDAVLVVVACRKGAAVHVCTAGLMQDPSGAGNRAETKYLKTDMHSSPPNQHMQTSPFTGHRQLTPGKTSCFRATCIPQRR
jgi:hypothetical protein